MLAGSQHRATHATKGKKALLFWKTTLLSLFLLHSSAKLYTDIFHGRSLSVLLDSLLSKSCCRLTKSEEFIGSSFIYVDVL